MTVVRNRRERGAALIITMLAIMMIATAISAGVILLEQSSKASKHIFEARDQAYGVSRAGLIDAMSWFRRQTTQPVTLFAPNRDLTAIPPINETDNVAVGLVRNYAITASVWARYEVRLSAMDLGVTDVTTARGLPGTGPGTIWQITSHGYVFHRNYKNPADPSNNPWNEDEEWDNVGHKPLGNDTDGTNQLVAYVSLETEIRRLTIIPPGTAAVCVSNGSSATLGARSRVQGGDGAGLLYSTSSGTPSLSGALTGSPTHAALAGYVDDWQNVFGMPLQDLLAMPDVKVRDVDDLPEKLPDYSLTYYQGDVVFNAAHPLTAPAAVLIVDGNLTIDSSSNSSFNGFIYVRGNYIQRAPSIISGTIAVRGTCNISGLGDYSEVNADDTLINVIMQKMGQYRLSQAIRIVGISHTGAN
jgi:hypothetical protein